MVKKKSEEIVSKKKNKEEDIIDIAEIKEELTDYIDEKIRKGIIRELDYSYKRTIREKNKKILVRNMIITILLLVIVYLVFILNDNNYFDKFFIENNTKNSSNIITNNNEDINLDNKEDKPTLDDLKKEYASLLDNIYISEESNYVNDYYNGKLTSELKNYLTLNILEEDNLTKEDNYHIIDNTVFKDAYGQLFNSEYDAKTFNYNGNIVRYITKLDSYISDDLIIKKKSNIVRTIIDINIDNDKIIITTVEGLNKDNKIYNIITNNEVSKNINDIVKVKNKLHVINYVFNGDKQLIELIKK